MILLKFNSRDDNFGDQLIFNCLYNELTKHKPVHLMSSAPNFVAEKPKRFREAFIQSLKAKILNREPVILIDPPGARFINDKLAPPSNSEKLKRAIIICLWKLIGARFITTGISVDPSININEFKHYRHIGVRDSESLAVLSKTLHQVAYCPDMACLRAPKIKTELKTSRYLISLREDTPDIRDGSSFETALSTRIKQLLEANNNIESAIFYAQVEEDIRYNNELMEQTKCLAELSFTQSTPINFDYTDLFKKIDIVISNRLHVLLPAFSEGLLAVALISKKHHKIISFYKTHGWEDYLIFVEDDDLMTKLQSLIETWPTRKLGIFDQLTSLQKQAQIFIRDMITHDQ